MKALINRAGTFPVKQNPMPHFSQRANLNTARTGVLHTTEGGWDGSEGVFKRHFSPHFLLGYHPATKRVEIEQLVPVGFIGAATKAHNDLALVQIEMIGFAEERLWLPGSTKKNPSAETLDALASLMNVCKEEWDIPLSHPWPDGDFGKAGDNPHRHAGKFGKVAGWYGHADLPLPDSHWDPGNLIWSKVFAKAEELKVKQGNTGIVPPAA